MENDLDELYFKDAFYLSSEGNLFVKSIQVLEAVNVEIDYSVTLNMVYLVGSIYLSINDIKIYSMVLVMTYNILLSDKLQYINNGV